MADLTLGLDIGSNSIGWALLDEQAGRVVAAGVRVFPEGVDRDQSGNEISKNEKRRKARLVRRQIRRRAQRKKRLRRQLVEAGLLPPEALLPADDPQRVAWEKEQFRRADPYTLRARAVEEPLEPYELGRVLLHLAQRRGFRSNRKVDRQRKKETSAMLREIGQLAKELDGRTLGQYLAGLRPAERRQFHRVRLRGRHTARWMYEQEFDRIWQIQARFHPELLTDTLREELRKTIFFHRDLLPPSPALVGRCELEPRLPRCPRADRRAQRFRLYQEVNNLRLIDPVSRQERPLTPQEREKLIAYLFKAKEREFDKIRKHLFEQHEQITFNLERGDRKKLLGMPTDAVLAKKNMLGPAWWKVPEETKDRIVAAIIDDDEPRLRHWLKQAGVDEHMAPELLENIELPTGYSSYSLHAIKKLLPHLERGLPLSSRDPREPCALREAGYLMPWERQVERRPFLPSPPEVTNPLVRQALYEVRKVVNAILRELVYRPGHRLARIHIELARQVRGTAKARERYQKEMRRREQMHEEARKALLEMGISPTRKARIRYLLWKEQGQMCIYSGKAISETQFKLGNELQIDHILPYSRSLDDSQMNLILCFWKENKEKENKTPYEWLAEDHPEKYEQVLQRAKKYLPYPKYRRFLLQEIDTEKFLNRQLNDTAYITTRVAEYIRCLGADVLCVKGQYTATLRHLWGLDTILEDLGDGPAWQEKLQLPPGEKNRLDHRHHAIDAVVVALTNRSRLQALARSRHAAEDRLRLEEPWPDFRNHVKAMIAGIHVSHRPRRRVRGALHEETIYGPTERPGEYVLRKELAALSCSEVERIRDPVVRKKVIQRLRCFGIEPGRGQDRIPKEVWREPLWMNEEKGVQIKKVRLYKPEGSIVPLRKGTAYVKPGSIHHVCIFKVQQGKRTKYDSVFVSRLEAVRRVRSKEPVVQRKHPSNPQAEFVMSLSVGDVVLAEVDGEQRLLQVCTLVSTEKKLQLADAADARPFTRKKKYNKTINSMMRDFRPRKVVVDPLGRIRWAGG